MVIPPAAEFRDFSTGQVKGLLYSSAMVFLKAVDCILSSGIRLYKERFLRYLRWAKSGKKRVFMTQCRAEMRRNVTYQVYVMLDENDDVEETQCDCAAGMGPSASCKHIQSLMLALIDISDGKDPLLELSCTDTLQTFHRPSKIHRGSPVFAKNISHAGKTVFDPRPAAFVNLKSYPDYVKNLTVNFCANFGSNIPLLQTIGRANMYAFENDHHYSKNLPSENFLEQQKITKITPEQADETEARTVKHDLEWRSERLNRIHSSTFGRILRTVSSQAKENLAQELIYEKKFTSKYTDHGIKYEPTAIRKYEEVKGVAVRPCGIVVCMDRPYLASTPDGLVGEDIVLEIKCPYTARDKLINPQTVPYLEIVDGRMRLIPTHDYYAQVQGQMVATERELCHFVVYSSQVQDLKIIDVPFDKTYVENMLQHLDSFFNDYFKPAYLQLHYFKEF